MCVYIYIYVLFCIEEKTLCAQVDGEKRTKKFIVGVDVHCCMFLSDLFECCFFSENCSRRFYQPSLANELLMISLSSGGFQ